LPKPISSNLLQECPARRAPAAIISAIQRVRQSRHDFVLHIEQIGDRLVEAFSPT
jgi:hypothetical protein